MRTNILLLIGIIFFASCEKEEKLSPTQLCEDEYFYYSNDSKIFLKHSLYEIWIELKQADVSGELTKSILEKYSFLSEDNISYAAYYKQFKVIINKKCDCEEFKNYLVELNQDTEIFSATPVFYTSEDDLDSYMILLSEVLTANDENQISESDFITYAESLGLELIESKYSTQHFKLKEVKTGFEALEIAKQIYESGKVQYAHPNFISKIEPH